MPPRKERIPENRPYLPDSFGTGRGYSTPDDEDEVAPTPSTLKIQVDGNPPILST